MNVSVLGENLEMERQKVFFRRFGELVIVCDKLGREADRSYIRSLQHEVAAKGGTFSPDVKQLSWLTYIERRAKNPEKDIDFSALQESLVERAEYIIRNDALPSGRMFMLVDIVDRAKRGELDRRDLGLLQYLVLEAFPGVDED
jgi:hypothetical protein